MNSTPIQWCDSTVNPVMACDGCELWGNVERVEAADEEALNALEDEVLELCYAGQQHEQRGGVLFGFAAKFNEPTLFPGRMKIAASSSDLLGKQRPDRVTKKGKVIPGKPWLDGFPRLIFISDMGDALSKIATFEWLREEIIENVISEKGSGHIWIWLTKRPARMAAFSRWLEERGVPWPPNLWAGTSITMQKNLNGRIDSLMQVGNAETVRVLSVEPQLEELNFDDSRLPEADWVIQGGASGTDDDERFMFKLEWARKLRDQCKELGINYFLKQLGERATDGGAELELKDPHGGDWDEWPEDLQVREMPQLKSEARLRRVATWTSRRKP